MKAAILEAINQPLTVAEVNPGTVSYGQVMVRILASGICGAQLQEIAGQKDNAKYVPHLMGHEGCGIVEEIGHGVTRVKPGDKVCLHWRKGAGIESDLPTYLFNGRTMRSGLVTTFSERAIVSENRVTAVPADTSTDLCVLLGCSLSTALGTIELEANVKFGESVMVLGVGGLGVNLIRAAAMASAYPIIAVDVHDEKRAVAMEMGAHVFINCARMPVAHGVKNHIDSVDVIVDTAGNKRTFEDALPLLSGTGRFIMVGQPAPGIAIEMVGARHMFDGDGKTIKATQGGGFRPALDIPRYVRLARAGILKVDGIITHRVSLDGINYGLELVRAGQAGRIIVENP